MRFPRVLAVLSILALAAVGLVSVAPAPAQAAVVTYYVNSPNVKLNVRSGPNGTAIDKLGHRTQVSHNDASVNVKKAGGYTWRLITFAKGDTERGNTKGWVADSYLSKTQPGASTGGGASGSTDGTATTMWVSSGGIKLNVRSGPNGTPVDKIKDKSQVSYVNANANRVKAGNYYWRQITFTKNVTDKGRTSGWVAEEYLTTTDPSGSGTPLPPVQDPAPTTMYVNSGGIKLNVRKTPNGTAIDKLKDKSTVSFVNTPANRVKAGTNTWRLITFAKGDAEKGNTTGWVAEQYLTQSAPQPPDTTNPPVVPQQTTYFVDSGATKLNLRSTPNGAIVDTLKPKSQVTYTEVATNRVKAGSHYWRQIEFPKSASDKGYTKGWVAEQYLSLKDPNPGTPTPEPTPTPTPTPEPTPTPTPTPTPEPTPPADPKADVYYVSTNGIKLNVRATPNGVATDKIADLTEVTHVPLPANAVTAGSYTWRLITFPKTAAEKGTTTGWVADIYLTKTKPTTPPPSTGNVPHSFSFTGAGYGHGIGMPQYGAYQMAREGKSAGQILTHYYQGTAITQAATVEDIRVQVLGPEPYSFTGYADSRTSTVFAIQNKAAVPTAKFKVQDEKFVDVDSNNDKVVEYPASHTVTLTVSGTGVKATILDASGQKIEEVTRPKIHILWSGTTAFSTTGPAAVAQITGAQGTYRHGFMSVSAIGGKINVVNQLKLNTEYLYGIAEVPSSWGKNGGMAALEAQAISARTYAMSRSGLNAKCDCNIVDDVRDQNFTGWNKEGEGAGASFGNIWKSAVNATVTNAKSAQVLTHNGKPVTTYYYSYSGGKTANSEDVWASVVPYLRVAEDPYSLTAPGSPGVWTHKVSQAQARALFPALPDVAKLEITASYSSGQLKTLKATASSGQSASSTRKADQWRTAVKGQNNKISTSSTSASLPGSWITNITAN